MSFLNFGRNMFCANFSWTLCIKTAALKMVSLYTFKYFLELILLVCSNLYLLKMMWSECFLLTIYIFKDYSASAPQRDADIIWMVIGTKKTSTRKTAIRMIPTGQFPLRKYSPNKIHTQKIRIWKIPTQDNFHLENYHLG